MYNKECVLVDIDGTLANCEHRKKYYTHSITIPNLVSPDQPFGIKQKLDWGHFLDPKNVAQDTLIEPVAKMVKAISAAYPVIYVSGRNEALRSVTTEWLRKYGLWLFPFNLYMRKDGDYRSDTIVKKEVLEYIKSQDCNPIFVIDDRNSVVKMWRENGLICAQVSEGYF